MPRPIPATEDEVALTLDVVARDHRRLVRDLLARRDGGVACFKMRDDLAWASGLIYAFDDQFRAPHSRRRAFLEMGWRIGNPRAAEMILDAGTAAERRLGLFRPPLPFLAFEFGGERVKELKSYVRTDRADETMQIGGIDSNRIICRKPTQTEEIEVATDVLGIVRPDVLDVAGRCMERFHRMGTRLEMVGVDISPAMGVDAKLYLSPAFDPAGSSMAFERRHALTVLGEALDFCGMPDKVPRARAYLEAMLDIGIPCNLIAIGFRADGFMETKINCDAWNSQRAEAALRLSDEACEAGLRITHEAAGRPIPPEPAKAFMRRIGRAGMTIDAFALDILAGAAHAKTYVRSSRDRGAGFTAHDGAMG